MSNKELEDRIEELEEKVAKLEKIEKRRKIGVIIKTILSIIVMIIVGILIYKAYLFYQDLPNKINEAISNINPLEGVNANDFFDNIFGDFFKKDSITG